MTQAWDFVNAEILWGLSTTPPAMHIALSEIEWPEKTGARILNVSGYWSEEQNTWVRFKTLGEIARCTEADLFRIPNMGRKSVDVIKKVLAEYGLHLGMS